MRAVDLNQEVEVQKVNPRHKVPGELYCTTGLGDGPFPFSYS